MHSIKVAFFLNPNPGSTRAHPYSLFEGGKGPLSRIGISKVAGGRGGDWWTLCSSPAALELLAESAQFKWRREARPGPARGRLLSFFLDSFRVSWREGNFPPGIGLNFIFLFSFLPIPTLFFHPGAKLEGLVY